MQRLFFDHQGNTLHATSLLRSSGKGVACNVSSSIIREIRCMQRLFFDHQGTYDLVVEQTFFCALDPSLRKKYAKKMSSLLRPEGKLVGVLFDVAFEGGPPFGGCSDEYREYFIPLFRFKTFEACRNSISPRSGNELFMILERI